MPNPERQLEGVKVDRAFGDKASSKDVKRPQLEALISFARTGDTVVVHSIIAARNLDDLRRIVQTLTQRGVHIEIRQGTPQFYWRRLSDSEPDALGDGRVRRVRARPDPRASARGIALAKQRGAYRGGKKSLSSERIAELRQRVEAGEQRPSLLVNSESVAKPCINAENGSVNMPRRSILSPPSGSLLALPDSRTT